METSVPETWALWRGGKCAGECCGLEEKAVCEGGLRIEGEFSVRERRASCMEGNGRGSVADWRRRQCAGPGYALEEKLVCGQWI